MRYLIYFSIFVLIITACSSPEEYQVASPEGNLTLTFRLTDDGRPVYFLTSGDSIILKESLLGVQTRQADLSRGLHLAGTSDVRPVDEKYTMVQGKRSDYSYSANEQQFTLKDEQGNKLDITFRISRDGLALRYILPTVNDSLCIILKENTTFHFPDSTRMWIQPMSVAKTGWKRTNPSYEENYLSGVPVTTPSPTGAGWVYPALFKSGGQWTVITEAGLLPSYCGTRLENESGSPVMRVAFPPDEEGYPAGDILPESDSTLVSPWRVIATGTLKTIMESSLGTDLAAPARSGDLSYIQPGYASWSWALLKDNSITYDIQKEFIAYAARMNWRYCLIDVNWDTTIGYEGIDSLAQYADSLRVGLILWYNSSGEWNDTDYHPKSKLLTHSQRDSEFSRLNEMSIRGVKIDFFGGDGQSMIEYYQAILADAAKHHLMVNFHGATLPRGLQRTYPNLMTMEAVKGFEFITFFQEVADLEPQHCTILPFTRNIFDPMDFTPMALSNIPSIERRTTDAFELALPVLFLSGIQHMAETPEGMKKQPAFVREYLSNLPATYDETKFVAGFPGKDIVVARRSNDQWFVTGINGEDTDKIISCEADYLANKTFIRITDGPSGVSQDRITIAADGKFEISLTGNGGTVLYEIHK